MNVTTVFGNLGRDPEVRETNSGQKVVTASVGVSMGKDHTEWYSVVCWGMAAKAAEKLKKGQRVVVVGQFKTRKWQDKSGNDRYSTELVVSDFWGAIAHAPLPPKDKSGVDDDFDDEVPF